MSYYGSQYGCNPKYLSQYIVAHYPGYDVVWAFVHPKQYRNIAGIRIVRYLSIRYFYELCTCKVLITNYRMTLLFQKRKKQCYIQTWHSSLRLKMIERDVEDKLPVNYKRMALKDSLNIDYLLSGCGYSTSIFHSSFWYKSFDEMAKKTMLRQLISKWGVMSAEIQNAFSSDSALLDADRSGKVAVLDLPKDEEPEEPQEPPQQAKPTAKAVKFDEL